MTIFSSTFILSQIHQFINHSCTHVLAHIKTNITTENVFPFVLYAPTLTTDDIIFSNLIWNAKFFSLSLTHSFVREITDASEIKMNKYSLFRFVVVRFLKMLYSKWRKSDSKATKKWQEFFGCVRATFNTPNMLLSLGNRNTDRLFLIYSVDFIRIENPYEGRRRRQRPTNRSTQINPFFRRHRIVFVRRSCRFFGCRSFIRLIGTMQLFIYFRLSRPLNMILIVLAKKEIGAVTTKRTRDSFCSFVHLFSSHARHKTYVYERGSKREACGCASFSLCFMSGMVVTHRARWKREEKSSMALNECAMSVLFSQSKNRRFKSSWNEMKME